MSGRLMNNSLLVRIVAIIEDARSRVVRSVNSEMVIAYWHIGREIVEEQQAGEERAIYADNLLEKLSGQLAATFGKGFSPTNLRYFRKCYLTFQNRGAIQHPMGAESDNQAKNFPAGIQFNSLVLLAAQKNIFKDLLTAIRTAPFSSDLSWSHYRALMRVKKTRFPVLFMK